MKSLFGILVTLFIGYGVQQGSEIDKTISSEIDSAIPTAETLSKSQIDSLYNALPYSIEADNTKGVKQFSPEWYAIASGDSSICDLFR